MKINLTLLFISIISLSFVENIALTKTSVYGIWQGAYGDSSMIENLVIDVRPGNKMELYKNDIAKRKVTGTYIIKGDTTIIFSYKDEDGSRQVLMYGNLNKTMNFVDGVWEVGMSTKGNFYLQKQTKDVLTQQLPYL